MRYVISQKKVPQRGDIRMTTRFLYFPKKIGAEIRWWEWAVWEERFDEPSRRLGWKETRWLN
jgi:hypothetical protein